MRPAIATIILLLLCCTRALGGERTVTERDERGNKKRVIELRDTVIDGQPVSDTLSILTYEESLPDSLLSQSTSSSAPSNFSHQGISIGDDVPGNLVAVIGIIFIFGMPALTVFFVLLFRHKNRKAKYRLAEQALANGQPLPEGLFTESGFRDTRSKGISNIFTGIGLFIFLWAITGLFGLGCIGLLVMFTGFGQLVIHYTLQEKNGPISARLHRPQAEEMPQDPRSTPIAIHPEERDEAR